MIRKAKLMQIELSGFYFSLKTGEYIIKHRQQYHYDGEYTSHSIEYSHHINHFLLQQSVTEKQIENWLVWVHIAVPWKRQHQSGLNYSDILYIPSWAPLIMRMTDNDIYSVPGWILWQYSQLVIFTHSGGGPIRSASVLLNKQFRILSRFYEHSTSRYAKWMKLNCKRRPWTNFALPKSVQKLLFQL